MNIDRLDGQNFLTLGSFSVDLANRGLLLIQGENKDDTSADSNGAGKSSIPDALCWALFGVTARGVSGDAVVNKTAEKDCWVRIDISDGANRYRVTRYRKNPTHKNALKVSHFNGTGTLWLDLTKGTDKETQEVVNGIMGCSLDVFVAAIYAGQEVMPDLPGMTDKQLKLLVEEAAGTEILADCYTVALKGQNVAEAAFATTKRRLQDVQSREEGLIKIADAAEVAVKDFDDSRRARAALQLEPLKRLLPEMDTHKAALAELDEPAVRARLGELDTVMREYSGKKATQAAFERAAGLAQREVDRAETQILGAGKILNSRIANKRQIADKIGKPCGECGKEYCAHDMEAAGRAQDDAIATEAAAIKVLEAELAAKKALFNTAHAVATLAADALPDMSKVAAEQGVLNTLLAKVSGHKTRMGGIDAEVLKCKDMARMVIAQANPHLAVLEVAREAVKKNDAEEAALILEYEANEKKFTIAAAAAKVFGPAGVRAHILDLVTPFLNDKTGEYLGALADGNIHATWNTLTKTAKGEVREKFAIDVVNDKGAESFSGMSGGEKRKTRLATAMALQDMVASRATKPINIFIADEVDHALDEAGLERLMGVLTTKAKERGTVLVISHNALGDWIDNVITVTKDGGKATVTGAISV